jgi:hypothetical protein
MDPHILAILCLLIRRNRVRKIALTFCALLLLSAQQRRQRRNRFYLTRAELPPNPRAGTAWQQLYLSKQNRAYILTMGVDVSVFEYLLGVIGFQKAWDSTPIPRFDVDFVSARTRTGGRSLDAAGALGLVLHHLNSTMMDYSLQQIFGLTPAVCSRYRLFALNLLFNCLHNMPAAEIRWPKERSLLRFSELIKARHPLLQHAFGFLDGVHLPISRSSNLDMQNAYYNGWCASHYTSNILAFAPDGTIIHATINAPGSWHDSAVSRALYNQLKFSTPSPYYLIADTAFPNSATDIRGRIKTPPKSNFISYPNDVQSAREFRTFNEQLVSARQAAEWGMQALQGSFGRLKLPMPAEDSRYRYIVLETCVRLHNVRARCVGINQIKTVYEEVWKSGGEYTEFEEMLFKDIKKNDRIRRFYNFVL